MRSKLRVLLTRSYFIKMVITCGNLVYRLEPKNEFEVHCHIAHIAHFHFIYLLFSLHMVEKQCNQTAYL